VWVGEKGLEEGMEWDEDGKGQNPNPAGAEL